MRGGCDRGRASVRGIVRCMSETRGRLRLVRYDGEGRIDQDVACSTCGHNLRTQFDDGACPKCRASVYDSARCARLCQHDPAWLRRLARSTIWICVACVCVALVLACMLIPGGESMRGGPGRGQAVQDRQVDRLGVAFAVRQWWSDHTWPAAAALARRTAAIACRRAGKRIPGTLTRW